MDSYSHTETQQYPTKFDLRVWKKLLPVVTPFKGKMIAVTLVMLGSAAIDIAWPLFNRYAVNHFIMPRSIAGLPVFSLSYFGMLLLQTLMVIAFSRLCMSIEMSLSRDLKRRSFVHLQQLDFSYYNTTAVGYILARVMSDTNRIAGLVAWSFIDIFWSLFYVIGVFIAMLVLNWRLALVVMIVVPIVAVVTSIFEGRILTLNRQVRSINSRITGAYNEGITGAKTSKSLVIEERNYGEFKSLTGEMYQSSSRYMRLNALFIPIVASLGSFAAAMVLARGGRLVIQDVLDYGTMATFIAYAFNILEPVQQIAGVLAEFISTQVNIERVFGLLERKPFIQDSPQVVEKYGDCFEPRRENWESIRGEIEFRNVWFKYPDGDENILEDFNLHIPAGTNVALVGETGAGKSTLVNLACRFFEPTQGQILIDGVDYRERSQLWLHSHLGYVLQSPHLFSGTVKENIRYGKLDATDEEIRRAASLVSADTVVAKLEKGFDTDVGEGGDRLSTGEKQLISFARAVVADPPIFVLDEATASIDTETEQLIQQAISHILGGRTSFLIAHRLSTIRHADLILVVRDGKIEGRGTHDELMAQKGYYYNLYTQMEIADASPKN